MSKQIIHTNAAPQAIGPYSQAVRAGDFVYVSGQIPINPLTGEIKEGRFTAQAHQVLENIAALCAASGGSLSNVVKLNVYLTDLNNFAVFNAVMQEVFTTPYPARAAVEVSALPKGVQVEAEAVLYFG